MDIYFSLCEDYTYLSVFEKSLCYLSAKTDFFANPRWAERSEQSWKYPYLRRLAHVFLWKMSLLLKARVI